MQFLQEAQYLASRLDRREISREAFANSFTRLLTAAVGCQRSGVWVIGTTDEDPTLLCLGSHDTGANGPSGVTSAQYFGIDFLRTLDRDGAICAYDAGSHPATERMHARWLRHRGVASMLSVAFSINGELHGVFTCASVNETMRWTAHQLATMKRLVARVSPALARSEMRAPEVGRTEFLPSSRVAAGAIDPFRPAARYALSR